MTFLSRLARERCSVMGVVNVTPDSFSDGGRWFDPHDAIEHGLRLLAEGADIIDVGGESTRPGADRVDAEEEQQRVLPVIRGLVSAGATVSVDTMSAKTAELSLNLGAKIINDVSGGRADPQMASVAADAHVPFVVMHWRAHSVQMQERTHYEDVVSDVLDELRAQCDHVVAAGVEPANIIVDPGLGFSKTGSQNWELLAHLDAFDALGYPVLVAASRKRFLGELLASGGQIREVSGREDATTAISALCAAAGAWGVRVHSVRASADAVRVAARVGSGR